MVELSIRRPIFITCLFILVLAVGYISLKGLSVDLFPNITFPVVTVTTPYPGAGPSEVESLVSKPIEDEVSSISGIKSLRSISKEGVSLVIAEFTLKTDVKYAEQQVRDRVSAVRNKLPTDTKDSIIRRVDPADAPVLILSIASDLPSAELYDLADQVIKPKIEQVDQVGLVEIIGGRKREIQVELDLDKLRYFDVSASYIRNRLALSGKNIPAGKVDEKDKTNVFRTMGEFQNVQDIGLVVVNFWNNENPVRLNQIGSVKDGLEDEQTRTFINGQKGVLLRIFRQSGSNTVDVVENIKSKIEVINGLVKGKAYVTAVQDGSKIISNNIDDVKESIYIGVILTIIVVLFFLSSFRSTLITGLALPNSLLGAFILMAVAGFSINIMTLLALSLAVGLLIDDAIVVRENIYRHIEMGKSPRQASLDGTKEVLLAVIATTMTVMAVFGPIAFLQGVVGQFFKEFGLTICFAMAISLMDAVTMAPMLSAYFAGVSHKSNKPQNKFTQGVDKIFAAFNKFQDRLENIYVWSLQWSVKKPFIILGSALLIFILSIVAASRVPKTFLPAQDNGEFMVSLDMPPGTSLQKMSEVAEQVDQQIRSNKEVNTTVLIVGETDGESNKASFYINLVPSKQRKVNTSDVKELVRHQLKAYAYANPIVKDQDKVGSGQRPFNVNIIGKDFDSIEKVSAELLTYLKKHPGLKDADVNYRPGKPEIQIKIDPLKAEALGVLTSSVGDEMRGLVEGVVPAVYRSEGREYDVRIRLQENQRNLKAYVGKLRVPNINGKLTSISNVAEIIETRGPSIINREDRARYIGIGADIAPDGPGMGGVIQDVTKLLEVDKPLPQGMRFRFVGQAENFKELMINMLIASGLGILFIYLVLSSLYESFVLPFAIMLVLPLAACGAFYALFITNKSLDLFSMIGCIMLLGIATKNSIILVDYINILVQKGESLNEAIFKAGRVRLRPILMTSFALVAGMLPVAIGLNEASKQRVSMGIAIIGGLVSSTLLTLLVVPAAYSYIERFRAWSSRQFAKLKSE